MARKPRTAAQEAGRRDEVIEEANEFFYDDGDGNRGDADLHGPIIRAVEWPIDEKIMGPIRDRHRKKYLGDATWREELHPRGQPDNKGKFGPGGGGSSKPTASEVLRKARENAEKPSKSSAAKLYKAPTKTPEEIAASVPGGVAAVEKTKVRLGALSMTDNPPEQGGFKQANGTYLPERAVVHERIVQEYINPETVAKYTPKPGESPLLTILGGRGGSGKSWLTSKDGPIDTSTSLVLDADEIKSKLPGYEGWNAALYHEESSDIVAMIDQRAAQIGMNVVLDGTLKSENIQKRIDVYQAPPSHDYEMEGYYMYASPETAATRAMQRFATQKGDFSGRFVPAEVILGNVNNEKNFDKMSEGFRKWAVYDNDADERGKPPKLVEQGGRKRVR